MGLKCRVRRSDEGQTILVEGDLGPETRSRLLAKMHDVAARHDGPLVVDVSRLSYFDSHSLTMLLGTERVLERQLGCPVDIRGLDVAAFRLTGVGAEPAAL